MKRVVVTGMGVVSPVGIGREAFWTNLVGGRSGVSPITLFDASSFPVRFGGEVRQFDAARVVAQFPEAAGCRDRKVLLALAAAEEALCNAAMNDAIAPADWDSAVLCVGVGLESLSLADLTAHAAGGNMGESLAAALFPRDADALLECGDSSPLLSAIEGGASRQPSPENRQATSRGFAESGDESPHSKGSRVYSRLPPRLLQTPLDTVAAVLGNRYGFFAGHYTNCSACAAGTQVLGEAWHLLREGDAEAALAGAADSMLNPLGLGGFSLLRVLSEENETPARACRPFDATRQGTVLGEGAAFLVLETLEHAARRGAKVYAEMLGYGSSMDAYAVSDPDPAGRGAVRCMRRAIDSAALDPAQIDCVNAHATGTPKNDAVETAAIKETLGRRAYEIPVHAVKSMTGHLIAASGAVEAAAAVLSILRRTVPPTINLEAADPACDLDCVPGRARPFGGDIVLSNSFGFGGQNATAIFGRIEPDGVELKHNTR